MSQLKKESKVSDVQSGKIPFLRDSLKNCFVFLSACHNTLVALILQLIGADTITEIFLSSM